MNTTRQILLGLALVLAILLLGPYLGIHIISQRADFPESAISGPVQKDGPVLKKALVPASPISKVPAIRKEPKKKVSPPDGDQGLSEIEALLGR